MPRPEESTEIAPWVETSLRALEIRYGGRDAVIEALSFLPEDSGAGEVVKVLRKHPTFSLAVVCARFQIPMWKIFQLMRDGDLVRAQVLSVREVSSRLPAVVKDVMRRATDYEETCKTCLGCGQVLYEPSEENPNPEPEDCPDCKGKGIVVRPPVPEDREYALKLGGLLKPSGGMNVAVKQEVNLGKPGASLDRLVELLDKKMMLSPMNVDGNVSDGEIASPASPASPTEQE